MEIYDVIKCRLLEFRGTEVQPENYLYDQNFIWEKIGKSNLNEVIEKNNFDSVDYIFGNGDTSLPANWVFNGAPSLCILEVEYAGIFVKTFDNNNNTVSLNFKFNVNWYNYIRITQIDILNYYREQPDGLYPLGEVTVVFSLTDRYNRNGKYYKVVAQILD